MAEMTASEAIRILNKSADKALLLENQQYKEEAFVVFLQISALIQQQQQTIEAIQKEIGCRYCKHSGYCQKYLTVNNCNDWQVKEG